MKLLFIADPLEHWKVYKDSTFVMMREAAARGHEIHSTRQDQLRWLGGEGVTALCDPIRLTGEPDRWFERGEPCRTALRDFDAVLMRKDPPFDIEYVTSTWVLERAQAEGARVFNHPRAIRDHNEKFALTEFAEFTVPTLITRDARDLRQFCQEHHDVILKPLDGMGGIGIFRVREDGLNLGSIIETLSQQGARTVMAQRFIPEIDRGDKRILLIAGRPVPYALARIPQGGEVRGNLAAGGKGVAQPLSARDLEIAEALGPRLWQRGLLLVGLDVIGDYLTEVNVTSPTCFREIMAQTGFDVAAMFIDALELAVMGE